MGKMIYLDNAATTKTAPEVVEAMLPYFTEFYGNASTVYDFAANSKAAIAKGRQQIADVIGAKKEEIYFTAGGSESDNWALKATFEAYKNKGNHIITTKIEHHAILHTCEYLEKERGAKVTYLDVDENGFIDLDELQKAITPETILISVMAANNEIGTLEPLKEIGQIAHEHGILFHTDAVQAFGQIPINVDEFTIDAGERRVGQRHGQGVGLPLGDGVAGESAGVHPATARPHDDCQPACGCHREVLSSAKHTRGEARKVGRHVCGIEVEPVCRV